MQLCLGGERRLLGERIDIVADAEYPTHGHGVIVSDNPGGRVGVGPLGWCVPKAAPGLALSSCKSTAGDVSAGPT
jgi:hypothetical protein